MEETILAVLVGIALSASCGFRVFVPLLVMSIAARAGHLTLATGFQWIGSWPALLAFSVATVLEIGAYYVPWLDNLLDTIATPAAVVAGIVVMAACVGDVSPFLKWSLAVIAGGGAAATVQLGTVTVRAVSSGVTGGAANSIVATLEAIGAVFLAITAVLVPIVAAVALIAIALLLMRWLVRLFRAPKAAPVQIAPSGQ